MAERLGNAIGVFEDVNSRNEFLFWGSSLQIRIRIEPDWEGPHSQRLALEVSPVTNPVPFATEIPRPLYGGIRINEPVDDGEHRPFFPVPPAHYSLSGIRSGQAKGKEKMVEVAAKYRGKGLVEQWRPESS